MNTITGSARAAGTQRLYLCFTGNAALIVVVGIVAMLAGLPKPLLAILGFLACVEMALDVAILALGFLPDPTPRDDTAVRTAGPQSGSTSSTP